MNRKLTVTYSLIGLCVAMYLANFLVPSLSFRMLYEPILATIEPWRYITAAFQHGDLLHLICNMGFLYMLGVYGQNLFTQLQYLVLFLITALGGSVGTLAWCAFTQHSVATVGASGATMGMCAAMFVLTRKFDANGASLGGLLLINVLLGFIVPNVAWHAHLGGMVTGLLLGAGYAWVGRQVWSRRAAAYSENGVIVDIVDRSRLLTQARRWNTWGVYGVDLVVLLLLVLAIASSYNFFMRFVG